MFLEIGGVACDQDPLQFLPVQNEEAVASLLFKLYQNNNEARVRLGFQTFQDLSSPVELNLDKLADVELPRSPVDGFDLDCDMTAELTRGDDIVVRDISSKRSGE